MLRPLVAGVASLMALAISAAQAGTIYGPSGSSIDVHYESSGSSRDYGSSREGSGSRSSYGGGASGDPIAEMFESIARAIAREIEAAERRRQERETNRLLPNAAREAEQQRLRERAEFLRRVLATEVRTLGPRAANELSALLASYTAQELEQLSARYYRLERSLDEASRSRCKRKFCNQFVLAVAHVYGVTELQQSLNAKQIHCLVEGPRDGEDCGTAARSRNWRRLSAAQANLEAELGNFVLAQNYEHVAVVVPSGEARLKEHKGHPVPYVRGESINSAYYERGEERALPWGIKVSGCRAAFDNQSATSAACHFRFDTKRIGDLPAYYVYEGPTGR